MATEREQLDSDGLLERADALNALRGLLDSLQEGAGGSLFFVGEAGLGKTSLLRRTEAEARSRIRSAPRRCAIGKSEGALFGTGSAFRFADQMFASLGADLQLPTVDPHGEVHRSNRFLAALHALDDYSRRHRVTLLLDDLHWSDADSLALVEFLGGQIASRPVAVVATLRPWPPDAMETARRLERDGFAQIKELGPLSRDASARPHGFPGLGRSGAERHRGGLLALCRQPTSDRGGRPVTYRRIERARGRAVLHRAPRDPSAAVRRRVGGHLPVPTRGKCPRNRLQVVGGGEDGGLRCRGNR